MRVLAIGAHPDDIEIECGGTLQKCVKRGDEVFACHLSDGDLGHMVIMPEELGKIRCKEAEEAGKVGGYHVIYGGFHDLDIYPENKEARDKVVEIIRTVKPDLILTHYSQDYMSDHTATSKLVFDASFAATVPHYSCKVEGATKVVPLYYFSPSCGIGFLPTEYVDITDVFESKKESFLRHESQVVWLRDHDGMDPTEGLSIVAKFWGKQSGCTYAEVFCKCYADMKITTKNLLP